MLIQLVDGAILDIYNEMFSTEGCETCDYGSCYTNEFKIKLTSGVVHVTASQMYDYPLTEGYMMKLFLPNVEMIKDMTEKLFIEWLTVKVDEDVNSDHSKKYDKSNVIVKFKTN